MRICFKVEKISIKISKIYIIKYFPFLQFNNYNKLNLTYRKMLKKEF